MIKNGPATALGREISLKVYGNLKTIYFATYRDSENNRLTELHVKQV